MKYIKTAAMLIIVGLVCISCGKKANTKSGTFDHTYDTYATVLATHVHGELVDYAALKADRVALDDFVKQLGDLSLREFDGMDDAERLALWLNAHNAFTLCSIIDAYPVASIKEIDGIWDSKRWTVAGKSLTLEAIVHDILRPKFDDARIHFAINNASVGCPALFPEPLMPERLDRQLDSAVSYFVNNVDRNTINPHENSISTTEIFKLYGDDFTEEYGTDEYTHLEPAEAAVLNLIFSYADESIFDFIDLEAEWAFAYKPYDWSLNDVKK